MKKLMNKLLNVDRKVLIFLIIICIIGIVTGSFFMAVLSADDKNTILLSLEEYMNLQIPVDTKVELTNNLLINLLFALIIWLLGISIIGLPIVIFMLFIKSFLLSFTISSFIMKYKTKGIIYGIIYNMPHQIINLVVCLYLGVYSIKLSSFIIDAIVHKKTLNFKNITNRYLLVFGVSIILLVLSTLYETYIMPMLLKKIANVL